MNPSDSKKLEGKIINELFGDILDLDDKKLEEARKEYDEGRCLNAGGNYIKVLEAKVAEQDREMELERDFRLDVAKRKEYQRRHRKWALKKLHAWMRLQQSAMATDEWASNIWQARAEKAEADLAERLIKEQELSELTEKVTRETFEKHEELKADNRRLQKRLKKLEDLMGEAPLDDWICQQDPDFETRWNKALQHKEGE